MTNAKYHRRARAMDRLDAQPRVAGIRSMERERLHILVSEYRSGGHRCMNGMGATRHPSKATA
jgi:hypothetical protein